MELDKKLLKQIILEVLSEEEELMKTLRSKKKRKRRTTVALELQSASTTLGLLPMLPVLL